MIIDHKGVQLSRDKVTVKGGPSITWNDLCGILHMIPEIAHNRLGWFRIEGPPSDCIKETDEIKEIRKALFPEEER